MNVLANPNQAELALLSQNSQSWLTSGRRVSPDLVQRLTRRRLRSTLVYVNDGVLVEDLKTDTATGPSSCRLTPAPHDWYAEVVLVELLNRPSGNQSACSPVRAGPAIRPRGSI